jgi:flagellin-like protein
MFPTSPSVFRRERRLQKAPFPAGKQNWELSPILNASHSCRLQLLKSSCSAIVVLALRLRALSPLLATIILIAIVLSAGLVVYAMLSGWMGIYSSMLSVQPTSVDLVVAGDKALLSVSVKNTGNKPLAGVVVTGYDDNGKPFKLALPPAEPGQASGNTLVIPLGVSNIVLDASGNNNHGTIYGATWVDGKYGKALNFDGLDDYVVADNVPVNTLSGAQNTVEFWIYWNGADGQMPFGWNTGYDLWLRSNAFGFNTAESNIEGFSGTDFLKKSWHHIVAIFYNGVPSAPNVKLYIDGIENPVTHQFGSGPSPRTVTPKIFVSGWGCNAGYKFGGLIDEVRIYNRASDGGEVSFSNANPGLPPTRGLVAWYPMDEGTNAPFSFTAGSSYALTITAYSLDGSVATQTLTIRATG